MAGLGDAATENYREVDMISLIVRCFIDGLTSYTGSLRLTRVRANHISTMCRVTSSSWKRRMTSKEPKALGAEVCEFEKVWKFSSMYISEVHIMKFYLLEHSVEASEKLKKYVLKVSMLMNYVTCVSEGYTEGRLVDAQHICRGQVRR